MVPDNYDVATSEIPDQINVMIRLEGGALWATVEEFPGVFATGDSVGELKRSLEEGIALYLAEPGQEPVPVKLGAFDSEPVATATSAELALA